MEKYFFDKKKLGRIIGKNGETKKLLEQELRVKIIIRHAHDGGEVTISGNPHSEFFAHKVIEAVSLGFPTEDAVQLADNYVLEIINMRRYAKTKSRLQEIRGRIIGKEGKVMKNIERLSGIHVCVVDNIIALLGRVEDIYFVKAALESLLRGSPHSKVFKTLEEREYSKL